MSISIALRPVTPADQSLLFEVYASSRAPEMELVTWTDEQKAAFLRSQFEAQQAHYRKIFSDAEYSVVMVDGESIGRLWVDENDAEIRILDLAILPSKRGNGVGTNVLEGLIARAERSGKPIKVSVENYQRSVGLLSRLGFTVIEDDGINRLMEWSPGSDTLAISTRSVTEGDSNFLFRLYRDLRAPDLESVGWDDNQISDFARMQFDAQKAGYRAQYPNAEHQIIEYEDAPIGRIIVDRTDTATTLVDITVLSGFRGRGIGTQFIEKIIAEAAAARKQVLLSVAEGNPARRLYERLGFHSNGMDGVYEKMSWRPD